MAAQVTGARYAALGVIGEGETIGRFVTHGADEDTVRAIGHHPRGKGLLGVLIREPRLLRLDDLHAHPESYGFPPHHPPMTSFLGAPVRSGGRAYGNLYLTEKAGGFDEADERHLAVLAAQAGAAVENALLSERLRELAVLDERDRVARELHDRVIQTLYSVGLGLQSARGLVDVQPARAGARIDDAVDAVDGAIRELRDAIFSLRPPRAAGLGLARGLAELAREYEVNALVRPVLDVDPALDAHVPAAAVPDLLAMAREAFSNAARHAGAVRVTVRAARVGPHVEVEVTDDGVGFDPGRATAGRGLENLRERAAALGAELVVRSERGAGTTVRVRLPVAAAAGAPA